MRSIWKGHIRFSLVTIPIRIFNAVDNEETISFKQLHEIDNGAIGYEKKCKTCGKAVPAEEIVKGYEFEPGKFAVVTPDDLAKIRLPSTKIIEIQGFVDAAEIQPALYDAPYLVGPDGPLTAKAYGLLSEAMKATGEVGVGRVVLSSKEEAIVIAPEGAGMMLYKLRQPSQIRAIDTVPQIAPAQSTKDERRLSISLVESMGSTLGELDLSDRYRDALRELLDAKIAGREVVATEEVVQPVTDILAALQQSLASAKLKRKPMERARGTKKPATPTVVAQKPAKPKKKPRVA
jgi:DNA end-binding protein Ku